MEAQISLVVLVALSAIVFTLRKLHHPGRRIGDRGILISQLHNHKNATNYYFKSTIFWTVSDHVVFLLTKTHDS